MKFEFAAGLFVAATTSGAAAQACVAGVAQEINGNWYCQAVKAITYSNFNTPGTYQKVTTMANGVCGIDSTELRRCHGAHGRRGITALADLD